MAMGLKPITPDEVGPDPSTLRSRDPGLTSLTFPASGSGGQATTG